MAGRSSLSALSARISWFASTAVGHFDNALFETRKWIKNGKVTDYYRGSWEPVGRVLILGKVTPFFMRKGSTQYSNHQSNWKAIAMTQIFNRLGYVVDYYPMAGEPKPPEDLGQYDAVLGWNCRSTFYDVLESVQPETQKILYATEMHWNYQNMKEKERLNQVYERRGVRIEPKRQVPEYPCSSLVDTMIIMGDEYTIDSYDGYIDDNTPIHTVPNAGFDFITPEFDGRNYDTARKNFLWFGGSGLVLKGLDRVLEAFAGLEDVHLYTCGPTTANPDFVDAYETELFETENIHNVGWVDIKSEAFDEVTRKCAYLLYPSGSEAAFPGAVINTMRRGLIPIVTKDCMETAGNWGDVLEDVKIGTIRKCVRKAAARDPETVRSMSERAFEKVDSDNTRAAYREQLHAALAKILGEAGLAYYDERCLNSRR